MTNQPTQTADALRHRILDDSQQAKLAVIEEVLHRSDAASQAIGLGLISPQQWPGGALCYYLPIRSYSSSPSSELSLSDSQVEQFEQLEEAAREPLKTQIGEKEHYRLELLNSGTSADAPTIVELDLEISKLWQQAADTRPQRDSALAVLDDAQRAKLAAFETALQLATEAIALGLIPYQPKGEVLCQ